MLTGGNTARRSRGPARIGSAVKVQSRQVGRKETVLHRIGSATSLRPPLEKLRDARPCSESCVTAQCVLATGLRYRDLVVRDALVLQAPARPASKKLRHHTSLVNNK